MVSDTVTEKGDRETHRKQKEITTGITTPKPKKTRKTKHATET